VTAAVRLPTKLFSWLIHGTLSVLFAEVAGGSAPFPFFDAWGLYAVLPLYTLHIVFLSFVVLRPGRRVPFTALFSAGAVFGLYEAYITKVIWDPTWGEKELAIGGVYLAQTAILVLYWHPFMAFLAPLLAGELLLTSSTEVLDALPAFLGRALRTRRVFAAAVPGLLVFLWLRAPGGKRRAGLTLCDLLPDGRQELVVGLLLAAFYAATGLLIRPESVVRPCGRGDRASGEGGFLGSVRRCAAGSRSAYCKLPSCSLRPSRPSRPRSRRSRTRPMPSRWLRDCSAWPRGWRSPSRPWSP
jgi:hypothetical protein